MKSVLICDSDANALYIATFILSNHGWEVHTRNNTDHLVEEAERCSVSVIILDHYLNNTGGVSVIQRLKAHPYTKNIPVIISGTKSSNRIASDGTLTVSKPFDVQQLEKSVNIAYKQFLSDNSDDFSEEMA